MIFGIGGKLSGGKTVTAVRFVYDKAKQGKKVLSNIMLSLPDIAEDNQIFMKNTDFVDFLKANYMNQDKLREMFFNSVILLDEIGNILNARRSSTALNEIVTGFMMMAGKLDCDIVFTFQVKESQVDKLLREICNVYANCYRVSETGEPLIFKDRKIEGKIYILCILEFDFDIMGIKVAQMMYDPTPYYGMYDTREITLLDRSLYMRGGKKDLRRNSFKI